jgi:hypothetical protein
MAVAGLVVAAALGFAITNQSAPETGVAGSVGNVANQPGRAEFFESINIVPEYAVGKVAPTGSLPNGDIAELNAALDAQQKAEWLIENEYVEGGGPR